MTIVLYMHTVYHHWHISPSAEISSPTSGGFHLFYQQHAETVSIVATPEDAPAKYSPCPTSICN